MFATILLDYTPLMLYSFITILEISEERLSTVEKQKEMKEGFLYLVNNCELYVVTYYLIEIWVCNEQVDFWRVAKLVSLFLLVKTKYGFNPYMQRIFHNTHNSIVDSLRGWRTVLEIYMILYSGINLIGKIYFSAVLTKKNIVLVRKSA